MRDEFEEIVPKFILVLRYRFQEIKHIGHGRFLEETPVMEEKPLPLNFG